MNPYQEVAKKLRLMTGREKIHKKTNATHAEETKKSLP
jgi:hypothetical protein